MKRVFFLFSLACALAFAQTSTSEITGTVRDTTGAVIPGATVVAINDATGVSYTQTTTSSGLYAFPSVPSGTYTITAMLKGFKTSKQTGNILVVGTPLTVDLTLGVGETTEVVNVEATTAQVQTENASIGNVVSEKAIKDLPLNGRNPLSLLVLEPGVVQRSAGAVGSGIHVNGSRDRAYNVTIDGIEANESTVPNPLSNLYRLTPDNVQEYKVTTSNPTPEEGRNSGANINVATRSGQNAFHGTLFEFFRNTVLNSNEFFANAQGNIKPIIKMNQFGGQISGPIVRNKTFFFFSYADQKINTAQPIDQTFGLPAIYTPSARAGIYRYWVADPKNPLVIGGQKITRNSPLLVDPHTGALLPGIRTCASPTDTNCVASFNFAANDPKGIGVDPSLAKLFASYPAPNNYSASGDGLNTATYVWNPPALFRGPNFMYRVDHSFNENNNLYVRWLQGHYNTLSGDPLNARPQVFPGFPPLGEVFRTTKNLAISYRHLFSPRVVNELTAGFSRFIFLFTQGEANPAFPNVPPYAFANVSLPYINTPRTFRAVTTPQLLDNLSIIKGSHIFRTGVNVRLYEHNDQRGQPGGINVTPSLSFSSSIRPPVGFNTPGLATSSLPGINSTDNTRLLGAINDIIGIPARLGQVFLGDLKSNQYLPFIAANKVTLWDEGVRIKQYNFFFQDEWRVRRDFVINYGLRWEYNKPPTESGGRVYIPDGPIVNNPGLVSFKHADSWYQNNNLGAVGPRLGFAWAPGGSSKTVIRAGWGISFDPLSSFQVTAASGKVPGLTLQCNSVPGGSTTAGCQAVPDLRIAQGFPLQLTPPTLQPATYLTPQPVLLSSAPALTLFDQNLKMPTVHEWNFNIQRELPGGFVAQVGYVGKRGLRLFRSYDINQIDSGPILPSFLIMQQNVAANCNPDGSGCPTGITGTAVPLVASGIVNSAFVNSSTTRTDLSQNAAGNLAGRIEQTTLAAHLRPNQQFGAITYLDSGGDSYYHALQVTLRKRFSYGLLFGLAYSFSKSIDDQSTDPVGASSGGGISTTSARTTVDIRNWRTERGLSDFDRTHVLTTNFVYDLPVGKGRHFLASAPGFVNHVIGGWSVNGLYTHMSGEPFSVYSGVRTNNNSHTSRADIIGTKPAVNYHDVPNVAGPVVFDPGLAFTTFVFPAPGSNGSPRNIFRAAAYWNLDLSVVKRFDITERVKLQFRAEGFNALNHPNFDNPRDASTGSPALTSSVFAQTCCATVAPPSTQTIIQTGESGRVIQLGLKLDF
ncbi:MAG: carboxypeptidase-like regulatory domain-containing protein [Acidobacteriota bacterium]|nr:carboxypeptidase-like regulatory domain-containing protein [Acidobacteriota bacterium]